jgi:hypothetical protein
MHWLSSDLLRVPAVKCRIVAVASPAGNAAPKTEGDPPTSNVSNDFSGKNILD